MNARIGGYLSGSETSHKEETGHALRRRRDRIEAHDPEDGERWPEQRSARATASRPFAHLRSGLPLLWPAIDSVRDGEGAVE